MKKSYDFCLSLALILTVFLLIMSGLRTGEQNLAGRIAPHVLRFHVLANSDSEKDQALKLEVRDLLLERIRTETSAPSSADLSRSELEQYIRSNAGRLETEAETFMQSRGFSYGVSIGLETCEFPKRTYGDMVFPAGTYDAVRVVLGSGEGQNYWCVLYPSLCFSDSLHAVMPEESEHLLKTLIPEEDYTALKTGRIRFRIRFRLAEILGL